MSNLSRYLYLARAAPGLEQTLIRELKSFNIKATSLEKTGKL